MTKEIRLLLEIQDIIGIRYECKNPECKQELLFKIGSKTSLPNRCPFCSREWFPPRMPEEKLDDAIQLLILVRRLIKNKAIQPIIPKLEIEAEKEE